MMEVVDPGTPPLDLGNLLSHRDFVRGIARRLLAECGGTGHGEDVDDVEQRAWVAALRTRPEARQSLAPWLATCVKNLVLQIRRGDARRARRESTAAPEPFVPSPAPVLAREEARRAIVDAVLALDPIYRDVVLLRYYEDLAPSAIARRLALPADTVKTRLKRAHARLRAALERQDVDPIPTLALVAEPALSGSTASLAGGLAMQLPGKAVVAIAAAVLFVTSLALFEAMRAPEGPRATPATPDGSRSDSAPPATAAADSIARSSLERRDDTAAEPIGAASGAAARATIRARIVLEGGEPVPGARVTVGEPEANGIVEANTVMSDPDGLATLDVAAVTPNTLLIAAKTGLSTAAVSDLRDGETRTLVLVAPRELKGRVIDDVTLEPIAGANVRLALPVGRATLDRATASNSDGSFAFSDYTGTTASAGIHRQAGFLEVRAPGYATRLAMIKEKADLSNFLVRLVRGAQYSIVVRDAETQAPLPNAKLVFWSIEGGRIEAQDDGVDFDDPLGRRVLASLATDAGGRCSIENAPAYDTRMHQVIASCYADDNGLILGYIALLHPGYSSSPTRLSVHFALNRIDVAVDAVRCASIVGRVVNDAGAPIEGAEVQVVDPVMPPHVPNVSELEGESVDSLFGLARTDAAGRFELPRAPARSDGTLHVRLRVRHERNLVVESEALAPVAGTTTNAGDLVLARPARIALRVVDPNQVPVASARIESGELRRVTDRSGRASLPITNAPANDGKVELRVDARGFRVETFRLVPSRGTPEEIQVTVSPERQVTGRLLYADGVPAAGVSVFALPAGAPEDAIPLAVAPTVADGSFVVRGLPAGSIDLRAVRSFDDGRATLRALRASVATTESAVLLRFDGPSSATKTSLVVLVLDAATRAPIRDADVRVSTADRRVTLLFESEPGRYESRDLVPDPASWLSVNADQRAPWGIGPVAFAAGETREIEALLDARSSISVRGRVRFEGCEYQRGMTLFVVDESGNGSGGEILADGSFEVRDVGPGRHHLRLFGSDRETHAALVRPPTIDVRDGDVTLAEPLVIAPSGLLLLRVEVARDGKARYGARIETLSGETIGVESWIDVGAYRPVPLSPGGYLIRWLENQVEVSRESVTIEAGKTAKLALSR